MNLLNKTIIVKTPFFQYTPPIYIKSIGKKRIHIKVYDVAGFYFTPAAFYKMLDAGYTIIDEPTEAKYYLTKKEINLLDI